LSRVEYERLGPGPLREGHREKLIQTRELARAVLGPVMADQHVEFVFGKVVHQLGKDDPALIHERPLPIAGWGADARKAGWN
jgi:hypothetical protein